MSEKDEQQYYLLNFTHEELVGLLYKIKHNEVLTTEQYDKLINEIGLDNISTFDLDFYKLKNRPIEVVRTSQLLNDNNFIDAKQLQKLVDEHITPSIEELNRINIEIDILKSINIDDIISEVGNIRNNIESMTQTLEGLQDYTVDYTTTLANIYDTVNELNEDTQLLFNNDESFKLLHDTIIKNLTGKQTDINIIFNLLDEIKAKGNEINSIIAQIEEAQNATTEFANMFKDEYEYDAEGNSTLIKAGINSRLAFLEKCYGETLGANDYATASQVAEYIDVVNNALDMINDKAQDIEANEKAIISIYGLFDDYVDHIKTIQNDYSLIKAYYDNVVIEYKETQNLVSDLTLIVNSLDIDSINGIEDIRNTIDAFNAQIQNGYVSKIDYESKMSSIESQFLNLESSLTQVSENLRTLNSIDHTSFLSKNEFNSQKNLLSQSILAAQNQLSTLRSDLNIHINNFENHTHDEYLTEHQPLDDYATKEYVDTKFEEFDPGNDIEHVIITEEEFNKLSEEEQNREDVLYLVTDSENIVIDVGFYEQKIQEHEQLFTAFQKRFDELTATIYELENRITELENKHKTEPDPEPDPEPGEESIPCTGISLNKDTITLTLNNPTYQLEAILEPENTTDSIEWTSSNTEVATVDNNGLVSRNTETNSQGTSFIYAKCGTKIASCGVLVSTSNTTTTTITAKQEYVSVNTNMDDYQLNMKEYFTFTNVNTDNVIWTIEKTSGDIGTLNSSGILSIAFQTEATAKITATFNGVSASTIVQAVRAAIVCTGLTLNQSSLSFTRTGVTQTLVAIPTPINTTDTISWKSSNTNVATVDSYGAVISKGNGTCTITVTCGGKSATCSVVVTIEEVPPGTGTLEGLLLDSTQNVIGGVGNTLNLKAVKIPNNASGTVSWTSSNNNIATVDSQGIVTSKGVGSCVITASCGGFSDTCELTVNEISETTLYDFELSKTIFDDVLTSKEYPYIKISVLPTSERYDTVTYLTSKNPDVLGAFSSQYGATEEMEFIPGRNGNALITITCYSNATNKSVRKKYRAFLNVEDTTENTAILYGNPEITMEGLKAKAIQNGVTQYFDVSYKENDWHPSYAGSIELTNNEGEVFYLAQTKRGTSPFGKNGLHLDSGGGFTEADGSGSGRYAFQASMLYLNNFDMNFKVRNVNNSMDSNYLNKSIEIFNSALPALNVTVDESSKNTIEYCDLNDMSILGSCWVKSDGTTGKYIFEIKLNSAKLENKYGGLYSNNANKKGWYSHSVHEFGHIFGISDNAPHLPSLYDYGRPYETCYYLQPNDIAWVEFIHEKMYGVNIITTQEDINQQVQSLDLEKPGEGIEAIYFDYASIENDCTDLIVECNLSYTETKILNSSLGLTYNIFEMSNINILEGEVETNQIKILTHAGLEINESSRYKLYLVKNNNSPYSLINPHEGLIELK